MAGASAWMSMMATDDLESDADDGEVTTPSAPSPVPARLGTMTSDPGQDASVRGPARQTARPAEAPAWMALLSTGGGDDDAADSARPAPGAPARMTRTAAGSRQPAGAPEEAARPAAGAPAWMTLMAPGDGEGPPAEEEGATAPTTGATSWMATMVDADERGGEEEGAHEAEQRRREAEEAERRRKDAEDAELKREEKEKEEEEAKCKQKEADETEQKRREAEEAERTRRDAEDVELQRKEEEEAEVERRRKEADEAVQKRGEEEEKERERTRKEPEVNESKHEEGEKGAPEDNARAEVFEQLWEVVGGGATGGLLVRTGKALDSPKLDNRLITGALVRERAHVGERFCYELVAGEGPQTGWVTAFSATTGKWLLIHTDKVPPKSAAAHAPTKAVDPGPPTGKADGALQLRGDIAPVADRRMRILALHGAPGNSSFTKFQTTQLRRVVGADAEWLFLDGPRPWAPQPRDKVDKWEHVTRERTAVEKRVSEGKDFTSWYEIDLAGNVDEPPNRFVQEGCEYILEYIEREGPIDVVVGFSNGCSTVFALLILLLRRGRIAPWRLNVFFCGAPPPTEAWASKEEADSVKIEQPTVEILGGPGDNWAPLARGFATQCCQNLVVIDHDDGHQFPIADPRATQIYLWLAAEMRRHCGLFTPGDETLRRPPVPQEVEVTVRHAMLESKSEICVTVLDSCTILDVRKAVMELLQETKMTEVRLVKKAGMSFTALANEEPVGDRREFISMGRSLALPDAPLEPAERANFASEYAPRQEEVLPATARPTQPEEKLEPGKTQQHLNGNPLWVVVGGAQLGGLKVKEGEEINTMELPKRLATGAVVQEVQRGGADGERVRYFLVHGDGPKVGWVSQRLKEKDLLAPFMG